MSDYDELVKRLREHASGLSELYPDTAEELGCKADNEEILLRIDALHSALREAAEALEPFAKFYWKWSGLKPFECENARAVLSKIQTLV